MRGNRRRKKNAKDGQGKRRIKANKGQAREKQTEAPKKKGEGRSTTMQEQSKADRRN